MNQDNVIAADKYAKAMFEVLQENNQLTDGLEELQSLKTIFTENSQLSEILNDQSIDNNFKASLLKPILDNASDFTKNFLNIIDKNSRFNDLVLIIDQFEKVYNDKMKIVHAEVTSATELNDDQKNRLAKAFEKRVGANKVILKTKVDSSIIGGVIMKSDDTTIDGSIKTRINKVKQLLLN
ncbi:ATP synthase F1 subunit delta [Lentilactobacillus laojiaonis]|uniref:ATP synthase F1 subunit delta n=1 Tax=Lentilactobacillus laojiaonis TaxID=2883998 RepID=UPI001D09F8ED|nr:ATP synthase F1 subunit delta [Lentilactobacillus laojiaonis]UDM31758.1 F0F1 ATP synthase subunit delta [Lentilactobacillus laojiaonis]